jgi:hypothetical protein
MKTLWILALLVFSPMVYAQVDCADDFTVSLASAAATLKQHGAPESAMINDVLAHPTLSPSQKKQAINVVVDVYENPNLAVMTKEQVLGVFMALCLKHQYAQTQQPIQ